MNWNSVADAIASIAHVASGINAIDFVPDELPNEALYVGEIDVDFDQTFRRRQGSTRKGTDQATITIRVLVARSTDKHALRRLRTYMAGSGTSSIAEALANNRTLNGTVHDSHLKRMRGNRLFDVGGSKFYGVELDLFVVGDA